jgi:hypothetical protein
VKDKQNLSKHNAKARATYLSLSLVTLSVVLATACGVRGRPQPPLTPAELGHGQPTFKRATEQFAFPAVPTPAPVFERKLPFEQENN